MVKIELTFNDLNELQEFLAKNGDTPVSQVAAPAKKTAPPKKTAAKKTAAPKKPTVVKTEEPVVDLVALREVTGKALVAKNDTFNDGNVKIIAFIKEFGVNRLSELPDEQLVDFAAKLEALV